MLKTLHIVYTLLGLAIIFLLLAKAWTDVDWYWDTWLYHFPFAARLWGIIPEDQFVFDACIQQRFEGFALLGQAMMGGLWRIFNRIQATNLLSLGSLLFLIAFFWKRFQIPFYASLFALLAVPIIQIHATISHVDIPGNVCLTVCLMLAWQLWTQPEHPSTVSRGSAWYYSVACVLALNIKLAYIVLLVPLSITYVFRRAQLQRQQGFKVNSVKRGVLILLVAVLASATLIKNTVLYQHPFHGMQIKIGQWVIHQGEDFSFAMPDYLVKAPGALRWGYSILEIGRPPFTWSWDQHGVEGFTLSNQSPPSNTMGGYFNGYVLFLLGLLSIQAWGYHTRASKNTAVFMFLLTCLTACLPMSHHLRYYSCWVMTLIGCNLALLIQHEARQDIPGRVTQLVAVPLLMAVFGLVVGVTRAQHIVPQGITVQKLKTRILTDSQRQSRLKAISHKGYYCVRGAHPFAVLYSAYFSPEKHFFYTIEDTGWPPSMDEARDKTAWPLQGYKTKITIGSCNGKVITQKLQ